MKFRKSVFIVVYSKNKNKVEFLVLKRKLHWKGWEFPKGGIERFELKRSAVKREIKEETGLEILKVKKFNFSGKFKYSKKFPDRPNFLGQSYSLYAVEVKKGKVKVDKKEHSDYKWLDFKKSERKLTWKNQRYCLRIVNKSLQSQKM
ncbi:MAG: NUDIX domain-containing protein [Nanoarchaeota archaeon]|nr:NUDIX domain-containing protein [Nanoarchaeota archaeon]